jgi:hypothetical protein
MNECLSEFINLTLGKEWISNKQRLRKMRGETLKAKLLRESLQQMAQIRSQPFSRRTLQMRQEWVREATRQANF